MNTKCNQFSYKLSVEYVVEVGEYQRQCDKIQEWLFHRWRKFRDVCCQTGVGKFRKYPVQRHQALCYIEDKGWSRLDGATGQQECRSRVVLLSTCPLQSLSQLTLHSIHPNNAVVVVQITFKHWRAYQTFLIHQIVNTYLYWKYPYNF